MTSCLVVAPDSDLFTALAGGLDALGVSVLGAGATAPFAPEAASLPQTFDEVDALVQHARDSAGSLDAIVVALAPTAHPAESGLAPWQRILAAHAPVEDHVVAHASWARAATRCALASGRPVRTVHITPVSTDAEDSAAQAIAQLVRSAQDTALAVEYDAFSISYEGRDSADAQALGALAARLVWAADATGLAGAELVVSHGWAGIRRHPGPVATVSYGGPTIPQWVGSTVQEILASS